MIKSLNQIKETKHEIDKMSLNKYIKFLKNENAILIYETQKVVS